ncbi:DNA adenine methylase [Mesorhizobium sp. M0500]|uniref:DNA adenine methylase n=1 Tax=Mesorhizobium sp. M0500 TaxID=2956953 RepID=UPI00333B94A4
MLDAFSGMCSVGEAVGQSRPVWINDIQAFAYEVGTAMFAAADPSLTSANISDRLFHHYDIQFTRLRSSFVDALSKEDSLLQASEFADFVEKYQCFKESLNFCLSSPRRLEYSLFSKTYSDSFFGLGQAMELDSILFSAFKAHSEGFLNTDQHRWALIALGRAMLRVSNSTGHFAQFLKPKEGSFRVFLRQRRRSIWLEFLTAIEGLRPVGTASWRQNNRSFNRDSVSLIRSFKKKKDRPSVIYADPPYTDDQYSRYYHLLETLIKYDYPSVTGAGLYRPDRYRTPFSVKSLAPKAIKGIISAAASIGADLVLSYPTNGLVCKAGFDILTMMRERYPRAERCYAISHVHSTLGASKGSATSPVIEQIFLGRV